MKFLHLHTHRLLSLLCFIGLAATPNAHAASDAFCQTYATTAVKQHIANLKDNCGQTGLRWSPLHAGQKQWCLGVREAIAQSETNARNTALNSCGSNTAPFNWNSLPGSISTWDTLFESMLEAIKADDIASVRAFHTQGFDLNYDWSFNFGTAFYHAIDHQAPRVARYLMRQGVHLNRTTNGGANPLGNMLRDARINYAMLVMLLNGGVDPNSNGEFADDPLRPLNIAVSKDDFRAVNILLNHGASPNAFVMRPVLFTALDRNKPRIITLLINRGANVNISENGMACNDPNFNSSFDTLPLDRAIADGNAWVIQLLRNRGAKRAADC